MVENDLSSRLTELINGLAKVVLDNLLQKDIDFEEAQEISQFILDEKRKISSSSQIEEFLDRLKMRYFIFDEFIDSYRQRKLAQSEDEKKIEAVKNQLLKLSQ